MAVNALASANPDKPATKIPRLSTISNRSRSSLQLLKSMSHSRPQRTSVDDAPPQHPELARTPPLPTLQKGLGNTISRASSVHLSPLHPAHGKENTPTNPTAAQPPTGAPVPGPPTTIPNPPARPTPAIVGYCGPQDPAVHTSPMPETWSAEHDRAICILDTRHYTPAAIAAKMNGAFPDLEQRLSAPMVDRRLRQLDQRVDVRYWGMEIERMERAREGSREMLGTSRR